MVDCIVLLCSFSFSVFYFTPVALLVITSTSHICINLQVLHLKTVTSLMCVEKIVLAVFFESLLGSGDPGYVIYVVVLNETTVVGALCQGECLPLLFKLQEIWSFDSQINN